MPAVWRPKPIPVVLLWWLAESATGLIALSQSFSADLLSPEPCRAAVITIVMLLAEPVEDKSCLEAIVICDEYHFMQSSVLLVSQKD